MYFPHLTSLRSVAFPLRLPALEIRVKQFTQDIIDTLGRRIMELELPIPKDKATQEQIITHIKEVFDKRNEAKELMRNVLLNVTPLHRFDDDSSFMTLV